MHTAGTGWAFSLQVQDGQSGRRSHHGGSSCCLSGVSQPPRQMRCPWRPSCLSDCGNSGLPKARGWERKQYGPCQSSSLTSSSVALTWEEARGIIQAPLPPRVLGCGGKTAGLWGAWVALPPGTLLIPAEVGGHFLQKSHHQGPLLSTQQSEIYQPGGNSSSPGPSAGLSLCSLGCFLVSHL